MRGKRIVAVVVERRPSRRTSTLISGLFAFERFSRRLRRRGVAATTTIPPRTHRTTTTTTTFPSNPGSKFVAKEEKHIARVLFQRIDRALRRTRSRRTRRSCVRATVRNTPTLANHRSIDSTISRNFSVGNTLRNAYTRTLCVVSRLESIT